VDAAPSHLITGQAVDVLTTPDRPGRALFASQLKGIRLLLPILAIAMGVLQLGVCTGSVVVIRRLVRRPSQGNVLSGVSGSPGHK
jgi:hypothetical protein